MQNINSLLLFHFKISYIQIYFQLRQKNFQVVICSQLEQIIVFEVSQSECKKWILGGSSSAATDDSDELAAKLARRNLIIDGYFSRWNLDEITQAHIIKPEMADKKSKVLLVFIDAERLHGVPSWLSAQEL